VIGVYIQEFIVSEMIKEEPSLRTQDITTFTVTAMAMRLIARGQLELTEDGVLVIPKIKEPDVFKRCSKCGTKSLLSEWKPLYVNDEFGCSGGYTSIICPHCKGQTIDTPGFTI